MIIFEDRDLRRLNNHSSFGLDLTIIDREDSSEQLSMKSKLLRDTVKRSLYFLVSGFIQSGLQISREEVDNDLPKYCELIISKVLPDLEVEETLVFFSQLPFASRRAFLTQDLIQQLLHDLGFEEQDTGSEEYSRTALACRWILEGMLELDLAKIDFKSASHLWKQDIPKSFKIRT